MEKELIHIQTRKSDKVLCGLPANMWLTAMLDAPVEDFCPVCLVESLAHLTQRVPDGATRVDEICVEIAKLLVELRGLQEPPRR